jgi:hypothetical protein
MSDIKVPYFENRKSKWLKHLKSTINPDYEKTQYDPKKIYVSTNGNLSIVRDDLLPCGGTKGRFLYDLIPLRYDEYVYVASHWNSNALVSLASTLQRLHHNGHIKQKLTILCHHPGSAWTQQPILKLCSDIGATIHFFPPDFNLYATAKDYVDQDTESRVLIPSGLEGKNMKALLIKLAERIKLATGVEKFDECWAACDSGFLIRCLQEANVAELYYTVNIRPRDKDKPNVGDAILLPATKEPDELVDEKEAPPFPSDPYSNAKVWKFIDKKSQKKILFWNTM